MCYTLVYATGGRLLLMLDVVVDMANRVVMVKATLIQYVFVHTFKESVQQKLRPRFL